MSPCFNALQKNDVAALRGQQSLKKAFGVGCSKWLRSRWKTQLQALPGMGL